MLCCGFVYQDISLNLLFFMTCKLVQGKKKEQSFFTYDNQSTVSYAFKQFCHREKKNMPVLSNLNNCGCSSARSRAFLAQGEFFFCYVEKVILTHKVWENVGRVSVEEEGNPVALVLVNSTYQTFPDLFFGPQAEVLCHDLSAPLARTG